MDIIHLLPDSVANQIAAGEVIQRPASVIKELVENAVDAGAKNIQIIAVDAGRTLLQVIDDGKGMSETDARLAFERHATSKIREAADLFTLTTMGFRGEALPSIVAVSQLELQTRTAAGELGTQLRFEGSKIISQEPVACPVGANFSVKNLFFNVPARRKFLKSNQTELNNISAELERITLVHPDIAFTFTHNGSTLFQLAPSSLKQRISNVFGGKIADALLSVEVDTNMVKVQGFVGKPESARKRGAQQFFFVNDRYMRHPYFQKAIQAAYASLVPADEQVPFFIYLTVPPAEIDVNIHPTKTEIKFENEQAIWQIMLAAVRESLGRFNAIPTIDFDTEGKPSDIPVFQTNEKGHYAGTQQRIPQVHIDTTFNPFHTTPSEFASQSENFPLDEQLEIPLETPSINWNTTEYFQYNATYVLTAMQDSLMLIHQHRAHVRVLYERYLNKMTRAHVESQRLLFPDLVQLSPAESETLETHQEALNLLGFDINNLGGNSWSVAALPAGLEGTEPEHLLTELLKAVAEQGALPEEEIRHRLALVLAQAAAIPTGQILTSLEMQDLVGALFATTSPNYTPDGQTILVRLEDAEIAKMFKS